MLFLIFRGPLLILSKEGEGMITYILHRYIVLNSVIKKNNNNKKGNKAKFYLSETKISYSVLPKLVDL